MIYPIVKYGHPVLEQNSETVLQFDTPELDKLLEDMFETMYAARGVGLAAPQIGIGRRIAVIDVTSAEDPAQKIVLINPEIIAREGTQGGEEGCLSIPTFREPVTRAKKVTVRAQDGKGKTFSFTFTKPGTYTYYCDIHQGMNATIKVVADNTSGEGEQK